MDLDTNIGDTDAKIRSAIGMAIVGSGLSGKRPFITRLIRLGLGGYLLWTARTRQCPAYQPLGISTVED